MHERIAIDERNDLLAGPGCPDEHVRSEVFEVFDSTYNAWAKASRRPLAPEAWSEHCPGVTPAPNSASGKLAIRYPYPGAVFIEDPSMHDAAQGVVLRADAPASVKQVTLVVDGRPVAHVGPPFERVLRLSPGKHQVWAEAGALKSRSVWFEVR